MDRKEYHTRVKQKRDTQENWEVSEVVLMDGELIVVDMANGEINFKVGDGISTYNDLSFAVQSTCSGSSDGVNEGSVAVACVLSAEKWVDNTQEVLVEGLTASQNGVVSINPTYTDDQYEALSEAVVSLHQQSDGALTLVATGTIPTIDIPLLVIVLS